MRLPTSARVAGILAGCFLLLSSTGALASGPSVDVLISLGNSPYVGDGVINQDGSGQSVTGYGDVGDKHTFYILIQNQGYEPDTFKVKRSSGFTNGYRVRYYDANGTDITGKVSAGTFTTPTVASAGSYLMTATVKVRPQATACSSTSRLITVSSGNVSLIRDAVRFTEVLDVTC